MTPIREILVPTDFSEAAEAALSYAIDLAKKVGARIRLVHAYRLEPGVPWDLARRYGLDKDIAKYAQRSVAERGSQVAQQGVEVTPEAFEGSPADVILEVARRDRPDLIVMGTRGLTGIKHVVLGSVAERTLGLAPCPVLTVQAAHSSAG